MRRRGGPADSDRDRLPLHTALRHHTVVYTHVHVCITTQSHVIFQFVCALYLQCLHCIAEGGGVTGETANGGRGDCCVSDVL